jgi:hypothetical protein
VLTSAGSHWAIYSAFSGEGFLRLDNNCGQGGLKINNQQDFREIFAGEE